MEHLKGYDKSKDNKANKIKLYLKKIENGKCKDK